MNIKKQLFRNYINSFGLKTNSKIVVIESDDWGSLRMPSRKVYDTLVNSEIKVENCPYSRYDSLETNNDYDFLFEVLTKFKDCENKSPIITTNFLTSNPDFERIKEGGFSKYYYESITTTYSNTFGSELVFKKISEGIEKKLIKPQFHGREHLNVNMWMYLLNTNKAVKKAFINNLFALSYANSKEIDLPYLASFMKFNDKDDFSTIINEGISNFNTIFGVYPESFIAPVYVWDKDIEEQLHLNKVRSIQGLYFQNKFLRFDKKPERENRFLKKRNEFGQLKLMRNCFFEPSTKKDYDWVNECLLDIKTAFMWKRPAVICSHRLNYMGRIDENNRTENLNLLYNLLKRIITVWPDVKFVSSDQIELYL